MLTKRKKTSARFDSNGDEGQMVERPLIKPEVRGAIPRISEVKGSSIQITFFRKLLNIEILYKKNLPEIL